MRLFVPFLLAAALLAASCSGDEGEGADTGAVDAGALTIFAPSSVEDVFRELAPEADFRFGSSEEVATAALDGEIPDVFASAGQGAIGEVGAEGVLESPTVFATNRLVLVVPASNPAGVESLDDLADVHLWVGAELDYATATLEAIGKGTLDDPVDFSPDAAERVASGNAEAALVYYTDALAAGDAVRMIELPAQALVEYPIAVSNLSDEFEAAEAFVELLLGEQGRAALEEAGFGVPPAS